jgi:hypothetical protein
VDPTDWSVGDANFFEGGLLIRQDQSTGCTASSVSSYTRNQNSSGMKFKDGIAMNSETENNRSAA